MDNCRELLSDSTRLVRGIHRDHIKDGGKRIHKAAFIPRKSTPDKPSPDEDGLSVSELRDDIASTLPTRVRTAGGHYCLFLARDVRRTDGDFPGLEVCPHPTETDPYHALVIGVPTGRTPADMARRTRLAELLAKISNPL